MRKPNLIFVVIGTVVALGLIIVVACVACKYILPCLALIIVLWLMSKVMTWKTTSETMLLEKDLKVIFSIVCSTYLIRS